MSSVSRRIDSGTFLTAQRAEAVELIKSMLFFYERVFPSDGRVRLALPVANALHTAESDTKAARQTALDALQSALDDCLREFELWGDPRVAIAAHVLIAALSCFDERFDLSVVHHFLDEALELERSATGQKVLH